MQTILIIAVVILVFFLLFDKVFAKKLNDVEKKETLPYKATD
jgi:uncharacterized membrane protein